MFRWVALLFMVACLPVQQAPGLLQEFVGQLEAGFRAAGVTKVPVRALASDDPRLAGIAIETGSRIWEGTFKLPPLVKLRQGGEMAVLLVERPAGETLLYADANLDKRLSPTERYKVSRALDDRFSGQAIVKVQLPGPPPGLFGVVIQLPKSSRSQISDPDFLSVARSAVVFGSVEIDGRPIRVELPFDLVREAIETRRGYLGIDANGDGAIDKDGLSPEYAYAHDEDVVFRVSRRYVSVKLADLAARRLVLEGHPPSDYQRIELAIGNAPPDFSFVDLDGKNRKLSEFRGRFVLLSYWSTMCGWAVDEIPFVRAAYEKYRGLGLEVLGLMDDEDVSQVRAFVAKNGVAWPNATPESVRELVLKRLRLVETPTVLLLDREGRIISRDREGEPPLRGTNLQSTIGRLLSPGAVR
jgi:peroxiredoxin